MRAKSLTLTPTIEGYSPDSLISAKFNQAVLDNMPFVRTWAIGLLSTMDMQKLVGNNAKVALKVVDGGANESVLYKIKSGLLTLHGNMHSGGYVIAVAGRSQRFLDEWSALIAPMIPKPKPPSKTSVTVNFWTSGALQPSVHPRRLEVPEWTSIANNYPSVTRDGVSALMAGIKEGSGKLILWHGEPGTGKTWALRSLLREWSDWCKGHYIVDPEKLFGSNSQYMLQVLLQGDQQDPYEIAEQITEGHMVPRGRRHVGSKHKLLILEDTGELISEDARIRAGQGLSRLLNVTDGMIGQGLKLLVLITTNEPIHGLHSAVSRPGRTAASIEFARFNLQESREWMARHEAVLDDGPDSLSLAELYAKISAAAKTADMHPISSDADGRTAIGLSPHHSM